MPICYVSFALQEVFRKIELSTKKIYMKLTVDSARCETVITLSRAVYWIKDVQLNCHHCVEKSFNNGNEV